MGSTRAVCNCLCPLCRGDPCDRLWGKRAGRIQDYWYQLKEVSSPELRIWVPSPLWGKVRKGGSGRLQHCRTPPHPVPLPQGERGPSSAGQGKGLTDTNALLPLSADGL